MSFQGAPVFGGNVSVEDAYAMLEKEPSATLVDVRTQPEWQFVGAPDLTGLGKNPIFIEWQVYPVMEVDAAFVSKLSNELKSRGVDETAPILFLCRSGVRSLHAAKAMTAAGWGRCYNISDGFEGGLDGQRHRGASAGWQARGLPWSQS